MSKLSSKLRSVEGRKIMFWCPGCDRAHIIGVGQGDGPRWTYNNDPDHPSFTPSILVTGTQPITDYEADKIMAGTKIVTRPLVCHSFVTDGMIQFLTDCTHELAGQTVVIPDFDS